MKIVTTRQIEGLKNEIVRRAETGYLVTIREMSRRLRIPIQAALDICEDQEWNVNIAVGCNGGMADIEFKGDYTVEVL